MKITFAYMRPRDCASLRAWASHSWEWPALGHARRILGLVIYRA